MNPTLITFLIPLLLGVVIGILIGWDAAIYQHRHNRKILNERVEELEADAAEFRAQLAADPQRAWLDFGKRDVLNRFDSLVTAIRKTLEH
jgi:hypothetical protein